MTSIDVGVTVAGVAAIAWVNWYFFFAGRTAAAATTGSTGVDEVTITVHGGYDPPTVRVKSGRAVRLVFDRQETSGCSEEVVIPDFGVRRFLPAFTKTTIEIRPEHPGTFGFTCGMSMLHGTIVAE